MSISNSNVKTEDRVKIRFPLTQDDAGYPPANNEMLWAKPQEEDCFVIDNIPFFVRCVGCGDTVIAKLDESGRLTYVKHKAYSRHSTLRLLFADHSLVGEVRNTLKEMGCASELSHLPSLISVDVPPPKNRLEVVLAYLRQGENTGTWEVEEACLWD